MEADGGAWNAFDDEIITALDSLLLLLCVAAVLVFAPGVPRRVFLGVGLGSKRARKHSRFQVQYVL